MNGLTAALEAWRLVGLDARRGEIDNNSRKFEEHEEVQQLFFFSSAHPLSSFFSCQNKVARSWPR